MRALVVIALIGLSAVAAASCVVDSYAPPPTSTDSGGNGGASTATAVGGGDHGAGGGMSSSSGGGMSGGSGGMSSGSGGGSSSSGTDGCSIDDDCKGFAVPICHKPACNMESHTCFAAPTNSTTAEKLDAVGDCNDWFCLNGVLTAVQNLADAPVTPYACGTPNCSGMTNTQKEACKLPYTSEEGICAGTPQRCSKCSPNLTSCAVGYACSLEAGKCVNTGCVLNTAPGTTDVGCGGPECPPCVEGKHCNDDSDCKTHNCQADTGTCAPPNCANEKWDGNEADVDCGGVCAKCDAGRACRNANDCASKNCFEGVCKAASCEDNILNQGEEGADCGGPCLYACP